MYMYIIVYAVVSGQKPSYSPMTVIFQTGDAPYYWLYKIKINEDYEVISYQINLVFFFQ